MTQPTPDVPPIDAILVTPRWSGTVDDDWYHWLAAQEPRVQLVPLPDKDAPTIEGCAHAFAAALDLHDPARVLVVGHSVSCLGWLHALARREVHIGGFLGVAAWWQIDKPWPTILPWLQTPLPTDALRARLGRVQVILGEGDPFTADQQQNAALWRQRLGAEVELVLAGAHFNRRAEPAVALALQRLLSVR
jgi:uncharacterized protein